MHIYKCRKITDISNIRRKIVILSANLAFLSVKKVIPNIEYSLINIIKIDKNASVLVILYLHSLFFYILAYLKNIVKLTI